MKTDRYQLNWEGANEVERGEAEALLLLALGLAKDERVASARRAHHDSFTSESYVGYQTALNTAAGDYFTPAEAKSIIFSAPEGNDGANRNLSRALLNADITYQAGPVREALWQLYQNDVMRSARAAYEKNG